MSLGLLSTLCNDQERAFQKLHWGIRPTLLKVLVVVGREGSMVMKV